MGKYVRSVLGRGNTRQWVNSVAVGISHVAD